MTRMRMDLNVMPKSYKGHKYIFVDINEVTNLIVTILICQSGSKEMGDALLEHVFSKYSMNSMPEYIIMDQDSVFRSMLINYPFKKLHNAIKVVGPNNPQSLQEEHGIRTLVTILTKHLTGLGQYCPKYLTFEKHEKPGKEHLQESPEL